MPSTLWIWDIGSPRSLRAVIILHSPIAKVSWHPSINELLMISCENERGMVHLWDPSWEGPRIVDFRKEIPGGKILGKSVVRWLEFERPAVFFSDEQDCLFGCVTDEEDGEGGVPWSEAEIGGDVYGRREESPLLLVPAEKAGKEKVRIEDLIEDESEGDMMGMSGGSEEVEDTFQFRRFVD
jgi:WD40 repeat protein